VPPRIPSPLSHLMTESIGAPVGYDEVLLRLVISTVLGAAVGLNRELHQKPAGIRTHALVCLGAALFTVVGELIAVPRPSPDALSRIIQGVVAGIGFLGAGVILRGTSGEVQGLTTAASIWLVAAVGVAVGVGLWLTALTAAGLALLVLAGQPLERLIHRRSAHRAETK